MKEVVLAALIALGALVLCLHLVGKCGARGRRIADACCAAPWLDVIVATLTWVPWVVASLAWGWRGLLAAIGAQVVVLYIWMFTHELTHMHALRGPRIVKFLNRTVGRWRNHLALWVTVIAFPVFWLIRFAQVAAYPLLVVILRFPRYRQAEWVNVSRQKFEGLIGHDLIWCLYCDWMTGVYSLGGEMLRNVESFWCPIRFYDGKKCENCRVDFPDIEGGWVRAEGTMADVEGVMERMYGRDNEVLEADGSMRPVRSWFGHPERKAARLTIEGAPPAPPAAPHQSGPPGSPHTNPTRSDDDPTPTENP